MKGDRIGWVVSVLLTIFILVLIFDEDNKNSDLEINEKLRYHDLVAYRLKFDQNDPIIIVFLKDGTIRYLSHFVDGFEQQLDFHDNGYLAARTLVDSSGNIQLGRYHFYESNGNLSHRYNYFNNKKVGVANSFHANSPYLKEYMEYDSSGCLRYRRTFDEFGKMVKEEGK